MSIYEFLLFLCLIVGAIKRYGQIPAVLYVLSLLLFFIASMRGLNVGVDTMNYYNTFNFTTSLNFSEKEQSEYLFSYINYFFKKYLNYDWYMFFSYTCIIAPVVLVIRKHSSNYLFSLFLYIACGFYTNSFNVMRQFWAMSIVFATFGLLEKKDKTKYLFWPILVIAYFIHNTALIIIPLFFLSYFDLSKFKMGIIVITSFIIGFFVSDLVSDMFMAAVGMAGRFDSYLEYTSEGQRNFITNFGMNLVFLVALWNVTPKTKQSIYFKAFFVSMIVFNLVGNMYYMTRLTFFYSIAQIICLPLIATDMLKQYKNASQTGHGLNIAIKLAMFLALIIGYSLIRFYVKELEFYLPYYVRDINLTI